MYTMCIYTVLDCNLDVFTLVARCSYKKLCCVKLYACCLPSMEAQSVFPF